MFCLQMMNFVNELIAEYEKHGEYEQKEKLLMFMEDKKTTRFAYHPFSVLHRVHTFLSQNDNKKRTFRIHSKIAEEISLFVFHCDKMVKVITSLLYVLQTQKKQIIWKFEKLFHGLMTRELFREDILVPSLQQQRSFLEILKSYFVNSTWWKCHCPSWTTILLHSPFLLGEIKQSANIDFYFPICFFCLPPCYLQHDVSIDRWLVHCYYGFSHYEHIIEKSINDITKWTVVMETESEILLQHPMLPHPHHFISITKRTDVKSIQFKLAFPFAFMVS